MRDSFVRNETVEEYISSLPLKKTGKRARKKINPKSWGEKRRRGGGFDLVRCDLRWKMEGKGREGRGRFVKRTHLPGTIKLYLDLAKGPFTILPGPAGAIYRSK